jgi:hypothetical protein
MIANSARRFSIVIPRPTLECAVDRPVVFIEEVEPSASA